MNILVATDSFKGSLTSLQAGEAIRSGIHSVWPEADVSVYPIADGGEGTVEALCAGMNGVKETIRVTGPVGKPVFCEYGILPDSHTAVIEMSGAAGLPLVPEDQRDPLHTTTYGVGEVIRDAVGKGCRHFIVGIGGSATNDGGIGMLQALGFGMTDRAGKTVPFGAEGLRVLRGITAEHALPELAECTFRIACDVDNPLCGENGCSAVYGPQKGASPETVRAMDQWMHRYAERMKTLFPDADPNRPGVGAAGGMGFAFLSCMQAVLERGIDIIISETHLEDAVREADLVVTGEGRLDGQSLMGKTPIGVARMAKRHGKTVIALCGCAAEDAAACNRAGIDAYFPVIQSPCSLEEAMRPESAARNLSATAAQIIRLIRKCDPD